MEKANLAEGQSSILTFAQAVPKYDNHTLNQLLGMWVIRTAQPWRRMEDPYLRAAFRYANPNAHLFGRTWVSKFAHEAYLDMRASVLDELKVSLTFFLRFLYYLSHIFTYILQSSVSQKFVWPHPRRVDHSW
jgi:hypothetical protein